MTLKGHQANVMPKCVRIGEENNDTKEQDD